MTDIQRQESVPESCFSEDSPFCPYCGHQITNWDEHIDDQEDYTKFVCPKCGKTYYIFPQLSYDCITNEDFEADYNY